jgi:hypothetical protein
MNVLSGLIKVYRPPKTYLRPDICFLLSCPVVRLTLFLPVLAITSAFGKTVHCKNAYEDARTLQKALRAGGTVTVDGTCNLGDTTLTFDSNVVINGHATLTYTGPGYMFASSGNNNSISGLTMNGGGVHLTLNDRSTWTGQYGWSITHNTFQNIVNGTSGIFIDNILGKGAHSSLSNNVFHNIWPDGYPAKSKRDASSHGIYWDNGIDNTLIDGNYFDRTFGNAVKGFLDGFAGHIFSYLAHNIVISNNDLSLVQRIGIEVQGIGKGNCPGGCDRTGLQNDGAIVKGNYMHDFYTPIGNQFAFSLMFGSTNAQYINNSAVNSKPGPCGFRLAIALETVMNGGIVQGNTMASVPLAPPCQKDGGGSVGWQSIEASGYTYAGYTNYWSNNIYCQPNDNWHNTDGFDKARYVYEAEYMSTSCPSGYTSEKSGLRLESLSSPEKAGRWDIAVTSNLAIRNVTFCLDTCSQPFVTQEIQDPNPDFAKTPRWLYHAPVKLSALSPGRHTVTATATDVAGSSQSVTTSFTR